MKQMELNDSVQMEITSLTSAGDLFVQKTEFDKAIEKYNQALNLIPSPKEKWEASTWIYTALGDVYFLKHDFKKSSDYFYEALQCRDGIDNPFVNLRLGQCLLELHQIDKSREYLLRAYMLEGEEIFEGEDSKYFNIIEEIV